MKSKLSICVLLFLVSLGLSAQDKQETPIFKTTGKYQKVGYSSWTEYCEDKSFLMQEKTILFTVGKEGVIPSVKLMGIPLDWFVEATAGATYYNGSEILTNIPKKAIDAYAGVRGEIISHIPIAKNNHYSFGTMFRIGNAVFAKTAGPEIWNELYVKAGVEGTLHFQNSKLFMNAGIVQPILVVNHGLHLNISFTDGVYLPHGHTSAFGEIGLVTNGHKVSIAYDSMNLGSSPTVKSHEIGGSRIIEFAQPDTRSYTVSLKFSTRF
ncbi:MAG: hypothetical protein WC847_01205 [Candidatus Paceibacterota bacterium]|jgi:hypothetical protein